MLKPDPTRAPDVPPPSLNDAVGDLFQTAVLLLGEEQTAALVVEQVVAEAAIDPCDPGIDFDSRANELMNQIIAASLARLRRNDAGALDAPRDSGYSGICIDSDDLSTSGISSAELQAMVDGPGRVKLRDWLEQLAPSPRAVFVLRAILGRGTDSTAAILRASGAKGWTADQVSLVYRQALCSLATSLVNSTQSLLVS